MIKFSSGANNHKLKSLAEHLKIPQTSIVSFDLPAGYTCPAANICKTFATRTTRKIIDGRNSSVRCYAANIESRYPSTRTLHWNNLNSLLRLSTSEMRDLILSAIPKYTKIVRIHVSGDFFSEEYFMAWLHVALERPGIIFYGYTKILEYYLIAKSSVNLHLIYSHGGIYDDLADSLQASQAYIVKPNDTPLAPVICGENKEYEDFNYICNGKSFSIMIHGNQKAVK